MKKLVRSTVLLFVVIAGLFLIALFAMPEQQYTSDSANSLEQYVPALMEEAAIPGLAIAKITNGQVSSLRTYGKANIEKGQLVNEDTLFNIASISKPIMGVVLLQLVDRGILELDRDINDYLPFKIGNPHIENEKITIRHLATHSSGIDDYYDYDSYAINQDSDISLRQHLESVLTPGGELYDNGQYYLNQVPGRAGNTATWLPGLQATSSKRQPG